MRRPSARPIATLSRSKYWRQSDAEAALDALADSGQSLTDFARQWGINDGRLRRWQSRLGRRRGRGSDATGLVPAFRPVEVVITESMSSDSGVELALRSGHRVVLHRGFDVVVLEELLRTLGSATC